MSSVLVTGANGFLGRHVLQGLLRRGFKVHALTRQMPKASEAGITWHAADLMDRRAVRTVLQTLRPQGLIHLAWDTTPGVYWQSPANLEWTAASLHLIQEFGEVGGARAVIAGSSAEYQWGGKDALDELATPLVPDSLYGCSRNAVRQVVEAWAGVTGASWAWGRIFNLFGPGEHAARLIPKVIRTLLRNDPLPFDEGLLVRDFLHVEDAGDAFAALFLSSAQGAVNIASGEPTTIRNLLLSVAHHLQAGDRVEFGSLSSPAGQPDRVVASVRRLRDEVGWHPPVGLQQRLRETCDSWRAAESSRGPTG